MGTEVEVRTDHKTFWLLKIVQLVKLIIPISMSPVIAES